MESTTAVTPEFGRMFLPGPVEVRRDVLEAQVVPMIGHRTPEMEGVMRRLQPNLKTIFRTERPVYVAACSGTGMMEAGVRNVARGRVLSLVNGAFSERFAEIAESNGCTVDRLEVPWGACHTPEMAAEALSAADYDALTVCHSETSTGVLNPVQGIAQAAHAAEVVVLVDTVSAMAGAPVECDAWRLDYVLTSSQKALAMPPGLAFGVAQENVLERARSKPDRGFYFDFMAFEKNLAKEQTPFTPAVSLLYAAALQAEHVTAEGMEARWVRHAAMARQTHAWVEAMGEKGVALDVLAPDGYRSPTVTCVTLPEDWTGRALVAALAERGYVVAPGYGAMKDRMIRIGHMGEQTAETLSALLDAIEEVLIP